MGEKKITVIELIPRILIIGTAMRGCERRLHEAEPVVLIFFIEYFESHVG